MATAALLSLIITVALDITEANFDIIWNVPTFMCSGSFGLNLTKDLLKYNILVNNKESFVGDKIAVIYDYKMGIYPKIDSKDGDINGGIPRLDRLEKHLKIAKMNVSQLISNPDFSGLGVIDWEAWRPSWDYLWGPLKIYQNRTIKLIEKDNPSSSDRDIESAAKDLWEETAKQWMLRTLQLAKRLRPKGRWCYYHFPDCYNYYGKDHPSQYFCSDRTSSINDRLSWMWDESTALCPSIYLHEEQFEYNKSQQVWYTFGRLAEAVRVSRPQTKIYPYMNYLVHKSRVFVSKVSFRIRLALVASMGLDGLVIWGSSSYFPDKNACEDLKTYVNKVIGPSAVTISNNVNRCSKEICNGRGKCTWPSEPYTSWMYFIDEKQNFDSRNIVCKCHIGKGRYCQRES
nr:hyaluronidase [Hemiscorpius lepturus]